VNSRSRQTADPPILIVEDKDSLRVMLRHALEAQGHTVIEARDQPEAEAALLANHPAVVLSDLRLTVGDGFGVLRAAKEQDPELPVIVMTAFGSIQDAVAAMKEGALDFLAKPVDPDHLLLLVERALAQRRLVTENMLLKDELAMRRGAPQIIGEAPALKRLLHQVETVAPTDSAVLVCGETGTGKELIARAIHDLSRRRERTFVKLNCAAIPTGLLESELFGHERGAFTGAIAQRIGRFELADGGTLFLDEVGDIPLELQPKLLRVLQEQEFERLGSTRTKRVDVRLVAATNRNLAEMVTAGTFRNDLYYRLNVFPVTLPPLRDRPEDIPPLVRYFVQKFARRMNRRIETIPADAMEALSRYAWPGNVRELENAIERAVILTSGPVLRVPVTEFRARAISAPREGTLEATERDAIVRALGETNWVLGGPHGAAARLGLKRTTLQSRMRKLGIDHAKQG